jgi:hypothetical protein
VSDNAHPEPTPATVKALYARAFRCGRPGCQRPLYKQDNETGDLVLNSRVAHIHARRSGGPRWVEMTDEDNRGPANLLLLCIEHSYEVDDLPNSYPADLLRQWKHAQLDEYDRVQRNWTISDADAGRVLEASAHVSEHLHASAVIGVVRATERLALAARRGRAEPSRHAAAWRAARARARAGFVAWDQDGNPVYAEPSQMETRQLQAAIISALDSALASLAPLADGAKVELAAARASHPPIAPWCAWISQTIDDVLEAASAWPAPPLLEDDGRLDDAIDALTDACDGLAAAWRGDHTAPPPQYATPKAPETSRPDPLQEHRDLLDLARPFVRVVHRPYDPELRVRLAAATEQAAAIPPVPSALAIDLTATCRLAAAVAANADDGDLTLLIERDSRRQPLCAAMLLLEAMAQMGEERGRIALAEQARAAIEALWRNVDWSDSHAWDANETHGAAIFWVASRNTSPEHVRERLARALAEHPSVVLRLVQACAPWGETRDGQDWTRVLGFRRRYHELPPWFPSEAVIAAATFAAPDVGPASGELDDSDDPQSLLAQALWLARPETV